MNRFVQFLSEVAVEIFNDCEEHDSSLSDEKEYNGFQYENQCVTEIDGEFVCNSKDYRSL